MAFTVSAIRKRLSCFLACLALILLMLGCRTDSGINSEPSVRESDEPQLAFRYTNTDYITAWGYSEVGSHEAELNAKARISEQISSSINAETKSIAQAWMHDNDVHDRQFLESIVKVETRFERAELIRFDPASAGKSANGQYRVFAYLHRGEYGAELKAAYEDCVLAFRMAADRAHALSAHPRDFTISWREARAQFRKLFSLACQQQAVFRAAPPSLPSDRRLKRELEVLRGKVLTDIKIAVYLRKSGEFDNEAMLAALSGAFSRLGLRAWGGDCKDGATMVLSLAPQLNWGKLMRARYCTVRLIGELGDCEDSGQSSPVVIAGLEGRGPDPMASLAKRVTPERLAPLLAESLEDVLPISYGGR